MARDMSGSTAGNPLACKRAPTIVMHSSCTLVAQEYAATRRQPVQCCLLAYCSRQHGLLTPPCRVTEPRQNGATTLVRQTLDRLTFPVSPKCTAAPSGPQSKDAEELRTRLFETAEERGYAGPQPSTRRPSYPPSFAGDAAPIRAFSSDSSVSAARALASAAARRCSVSSGVNKFRPIAGSYRRSAEPSNHRSRPSPRSRSPVRHSTACAPASTGTPRGTVRNPAAPAPGIPRAGHT